MKFMLLVLFACLGFFALPACHNQTLAQPGAYNGDVFLFNADQTLTSSFKIFDVFVKWEYNNRELLAPHREIKKSADYIRENIVHWRDTAFALRDAYTANPTPANRDKLTSILTVIQTALAEASKYLTEIPTPVKPQ